MYTPGYFLVPAPFTSRYQKIMIKFRYLFSFHPRNCRKIWISSRKVTSERISRITWLISATSPATYFSPITGITGAEHDKVTRLEAPQEIVEASLPLPENFSLKCNFTVFVQFINKIQLRVGDVYVTLSDKMSYFVRMELWPVWWSVRNLESNETSPSSLAQKLTKLWGFKNGIKEKPFLKKTAL